MENPKTPPTLSPGALRLMLAVAASAVLMALGWAGLQVRSQRAQILQLEERMRRTSTPQSPGAADAEIQLAAESAARKKDAETAAARETELQSVITFLRGELKSANDALERLRQQADRAP